MIIIVIGLTEQPKAINILPKLRVYRRKPNLFALEGICVEYVPSSATCQNLSKSASLLTLKLLNLMKPLSSDY
jgi:hypothetical protein